jgi:heme/copper-type cytochrome/quinol oxidase subunit 2
MTITQAIALLLVVYAALAWSVWKVRKANAKAQAAELQREQEHAALEARYMSPRMSEAQIAELHASRWQGD